MASGLASLWVDLRVTQIVIGIKYSITQNVIKRFCRHAGISATVHNGPQPTANHMSIREFVALYDTRTPAAMADQVYENHNLTSARNGILKAEAACLFARVLQRFDVDYMQDIGKAIASPDFEEQIRQIPGQRSGISLKYFLMLSGSEDLIKPDRMIVGLGSD